MMLLWLTLIFSALLGAWAHRLTVRGSDIYDGNKRIKFKGIGVTCTEYMLKTGMDQPSKGEYPGQWAYNFCFGGPPSNLSRTVEVNKEVGYMLKYLLPDSKGGDFKTRPSVTKVKFKAPHSDAVNESPLESRPITRIPMTGSLYLYESNYALYQAVIDAVVQAFTSKGVAVILDMHWNCPDTSEIGSGCTGAQAAPMALRQFGTKPGAVAFWDAISKRYASNPLVLYELFNEPWVMQYQDWYEGGTTYAGMKYMYEAVRKNAPDGLIIIGGKDQYALDAQSGLAFHLQYKSETGSYPTNVLWNIHPYVGLGQGLEHSLQSALRIALALKTIGPVIFTEFGQYCCGGTDSPCSGAGTCADHDHGDFFVHNVINMAEQYDISWVGWAWRGSGTNNMHRPCKEGMAECSQPDIRDIDDFGNAVLTDGRHAGADWKTAWSTFVAPSGGIVAVQDTLSQNVSAPAAQPAGFLPRPCIVDKMNLGNVCGWNGKTDVNGLSPADFTAQSIYTSILPGLPGSCEKQGCGSFHCDTYTGPCHKGGSSQQQQQSLPQPYPQPQPWMQPQPQPFPRPLPQPLPQPWPQSAGSPSPAQPSPNMGVAQNPAPQPQRPIFFAGGSLPAAQPSPTRGEGGSTKQPVTVQQPAPAVPSVQTPSQAQPGNALGVVGGASTEAYCCFAWDQQQADQCCGCYPTSRTKPGEWCGVSQERCSGCSGGHAKYCPTGCASGVMQKDAVPTQVLELQTRATWKNHSVTKAAAACLTGSAGLLLLATLAGAAIRWRRLSQALPPLSPDDEQRAALRSLSDERHAQAP